MILNVLNGKQLFYPGPREAFGDYDGLLRETPAELRKIVNAWLACGPDFERFRQQHSKIWEDVNRYWQKTPTALVAAEVGGGAAIALCGMWLQNAVSTIISYASVGIYIAFQMVVAGALYARARGWTPAGPFTLGRWGWPVNLLALGYGIFAIINMLWPRSPHDPWYTNYGMMVTTAGVLVLGTLYMVLAKPYDHGNAPAGDAYRLHR